MKPKGKKFRIRRTGTSSTTGAGQQADTTGSDSEDGFGPGAFPGSAAAADAGQPAQGLSIEQELAAIRQEGLTGRQLRMARRTAQKHGLQPASDFDAVRLLRRQGIDPFERSNMLELVVNEGRQKSDAARLPATVRQPPVPAPPGAVAPPTVDEATRAQEILRMQRDIAARRHRQRHPRRPEADRCRNQRNADDAQPHPAGHRSGPSRRRVRRLLRLRKSVSHHASRRPEGSSQPITPLSGGRRGARTGSRRRSPWFRAGPCPISPGNRRARGCR